MKEVLNTVKIRKKTSFVFSPKTKKDKEYLKSLERMLKEKRHGDWRLISEILTIPTQSVIMSFYRVHQKNHFEVVNELKNIIQERKLKISQMTKK